MACKQDVRVGHFYSYFRHGHTIRQIPHDTPLADALCQVYGLRRAPSNDFGGMPQRARQTACVRRAARSD